MTEKELRKASRTELLQMLLLQSEEMEKNKKKYKDEVNSLGKRIKELEEALADREIKINDSGTMAEAALKLNEVFEAADNAVAQYKSNMQHMCMIQERATKVIIKNAKKQAAEIIAQARTQTNTDNREKTKSSKIMTSLPSRIQNQKRTQKTTDEA